jgi:hypothetical protein
MKMSISFSISGRSASPKAPSPRPTATRRFKETIQTERTGEVRNE